MRTRTMCILLAVMVVLGTAGAAAAAAFQGGQRVSPALTVTVRDACTLTAVPNVTVQLEEIDGALSASTAPIAPSSSAGTSYSFASLASPSFSVQVSAPGYEPLGRASDPTVGVELSQAAGPIQLTNGAFVTETVDAAVLLTPVAPCSSPAKASLTAVRGTVYDSDDGSPIDAPAVTITPNASNAAGKAPSPPKVSSNTFTESSLAPGSYELTVSSPMSPTVFVPVVGSKPLPPSGSIAVGVTVSVGLPTFGDDGAPAIVSLASSSAEPSVGVSTHLSAIADDPVPWENTHLTYLWSETGAACTLATPADASTDVTCSAAGTAELTFTVTDAGGLTATQSFALTVVPAG